MSRQKLYVASSKPPNASGAKYLLCLVPVTKLWQDYHHSRGTLSELSVDCWPLTRDKWVQGQGVKGKKSPCSWGKKYVIYSSTDITQYHLHTPADNGHCWISSLPEVTWKNPLSQQATDKWAEVTEAALTRAKSRRAVHEYIRRCRLSSHSNRRGRFFFSTKQTRIFHHYHRCCAHRENM